ncbi:MAG TPA: ThiF family adenylyltransferase [Bryobacteraceae bacterium]|nr:ThiF family adenylyltransferase [Bryobacteraceae bacterium]
MPDASLHITAQELADRQLAEDRFSRFRLLPWWNQDRIRETNLLVIGAGALGNEILKNLAMLGFERVVVVDGDHIELSNLSRSVLYRPDDVGRAKAEAAAAAYRQLYDRAVVRPLVANVLWDVGTGLFSWADVILAGLDNREARLWINRWAWKMRRPWVDGAIEGLSGVARMFLPGQPPCYECTLGEKDWEILERRMSCNLLTREEMTAGKVPTTPTTASVIAGIQVQECLKYLHGLPVLAGAGFVFDGMNHTSYRVEYTDNPECLSHYVYENVMRLPESSADLSLGDLHALAVRELGSRDTVVEFSRDLIHKLVCPQCGEEEEVFAPVGSVSAERGRCPRDGCLRAVSAIHSYHGTESFGSGKLSALGLPPFDVYTARSGEREIAMLIAGDEAAVLGPLHVATAVTV